MNKLLETFDDFIDDCLIGDESICIRELELLAHQFIKDNEEVSEFVKSL